jgi:hypothetical protein
MRLGPIALSFTLGPEDLSGMSEQYDELLESRSSVRLRRGTLPHDFPVIGLAELIATKLTRRGDKAKDLIDVEQLVAALRDVGRTVDLAPARRLVARDVAARELLDDLAQRLEGGRP